MKILGQLLLSELSHEEEMKLNLLCVCARSKRNMDKLLKELPSLSPADNTVFGEFGADGEYLIPDVSYFMELLPILPQHRLTDRVMEINRFEQNLDQHTAAEDLFKLPAGCPCAAMPFRFAHHKDAHNSCMVWDGKTDVDDPYAAAVWLANVVQHMGLHFVAGKMSYISNKIIYTITVDKDGNLGITGKPGQTIKKKDFDVFYSELSPVPSHYAVIFAPEILRNCERFTGRNVNDEEAIYDDSLWELDENMSGYAGIVEAFSEDEALKVAAKQFKCKAEYLTVLKLA